MCYGRINSAKACCYQVIPNACPPVIHSFHSCRVNSMYNYRWFLVQTLATCTFLISFIMYSCARPAVNKPIRRRRRKRRNNGNPNGIGNGATRALTIGAHIQHNNNNSNVGTPNNVISPQSDGITGTSVDSNNGGHGSNGMSVGMVPSSSWSRNTSTNSPLPISTANSSMSGTGTGNGTTNGVTGSVGSEEKNTLAGHIGVTAGDTTEWEYGNNNNGGNLSGISRSSSFSHSDGGFTSDTNGDFSDTDDTTTDGGMDSDREWPAPTTNVNGMRPVSSLLGSGINSPHTRTAAVPPNASSRAMANNNNNNVAANENTVAPHEDFANCYSVVPVGYALVSHRCSYHLSYPSLMMMMIHMITNRRSSCGLN
jgi:hypothetical protein